MARPNQQRYRYPQTQQTNLRNSQKKPRRWIIAVVIVLVAALLLGGIIWYFSNLYAKVGNTPIPEDAVQQFDKSQYPLDDPVSPWIVVNKQRPLQPKTYAPADLRAPNIKLKGGKTTEAMQMRSEAATALEALTAAAQSDGLTLMLVSGYRSYDSQKTIYDSEVRGFGRAVADQESARPGYSEHQTGWAADLAGSGGDCEVEACFADTPEGQWLAANAYKYGFIIRYTPGKTPITGYVAEPWHIRYVGTGLAAEMQRTNTQTLEEFFGLPAVPAY